MNLIFSCTLEIANCNLYYSHDKFLFIQYLFETQSGFLSFGMQLTEPEFSAKGRRYTSERSCLLSFWRYRRRLEPSNN